MNKEYYLILKGQRISVSKEVYYEYWQLTNHERYCQRKDRESGMYPFSFYLSGNPQFEENLVDEAMDLEQIVENHLIIEDVRAALEQLSEEERELIHYLFFDELPLRTVAEIYQISHPAVLKRRNKIFAKLKALLG